MSCRVHGKLIFVDFHFSISFFKDNVWRKNYAATKYIFFLVIFIYF